MLPVSIRSVNFLKGWQSKYIMKTDKEYGPFFAGKGVK